MKNLWPWCGNRLYHRQFDRQCKRRVVRGCRVPFNNELSNLENSPTADAAPFHRYKSLASLVKSAPRDRRQFKCTPWMKEWWRYTKRKERGQPGRNPKEKWTGLGWRRYTMYLYTSIVSIALADLSLSIAKKQDLYKPYKLHARC